MNNFFLRKIESLCFNYLRNLNSFISNIEIMTDLTLTFFEFYIIFGLYILLFGFSVVSAEPLIIFVSIFIFLILIIPFFSIINQIESFLLINQLNDTTIFNIVLSSSKLILLLIGVFLFLELIYTSFYN